MNIVNEKIVVSNGKINIEEGIVFYDEMQTALEVMAKMSEVELNNMQKKYKAKYSEIKIAKTFESYAELPFTARENSDSLKEMIMLIMIPYEFERRKSCCQK